MSCLKIPNIAHQWNIISWTAKKYIKFLLFSITLKQSTVTFCFWGRKVIKRFQRIHIHSIMKPIWDKQIDSNNNKLIICYMLSLQKLMLISLLFYLRFLSFICLIVHAWPKVHQNVKIAKTKFCLEVKT